MKKFKNLEEGLFFHKYCILCKKPISCPGECTYEISGGGETNYDLSFEYYLWSGTWIRVNARTECVETFTKAYENNYSINTPSSAYKSFSSSPPQSGKEYFCYYISCQSCLNFNYSLQLILNWGTLRIEEVFLNSESVTFHNNGNMYYISNRYSFNKTEFLVDIYNSGYPGPVKNPIIMPLIELDYENPENTLEKVKKLIIFS